jgi:hypothetical protein
MSANDASVLLSYYIPVSSRAAKNLRDVVAHASGASAPDATNIAGFFPVHQLTGIAGLTE